MIPRTLSVATMVVICHAFLATGATAQTIPDTPAGLLADSKIAGGLVVYVGLEDNTDLAALRPANSYLVQGLDTDAAAVATARKTLLTNGTYGSISVDLWDGKSLPYVDNLVNLLVLAKGRVEVQEIFRVLAPGGVAYVKNAKKGWIKHVKPRPVGIDDWTHFLHGPDNNAVAADTVVGEPRHLQWLAGPTHARSHEHLATVTTVVSAAGRLFYIADEGPTLAVGLPAKWDLVARDAFNGVELWRRAIETWERHLRWFRSGPGELGRRLVAVGDRVYITLGIGQPVVALDAKTGKTLTTYTGTENTSEILCDDGVLYLLIVDLKAQAAAEQAAKRGEKISEVRHKLMAVRAKDGKVLWTRDDAQTAFVLPTTPALSEGKLFYQNRQAVVCLNAHDGKTLWSTPRATGKSVIPQSPPTLVVHDDVVLSADPTAPGPPADPDAVPPSYKNHLMGNPGELVAFSTADGKVLWKAQCFPNFMAPVDVLVVDGVVWTGQLHSVVNVGVTGARDLHTGKIVRKRPPDDPDKIVVSHHRCHRFRATDRFLVLSRAGIELLDVRTGEMSFNHWIRGTCQLGPIPCNGLLYAPPHACACYSEAMLPGFAAVAASRQAAPTPEPALVKGPAYDALAAEKPAADDTTDWPTFRGGNARHSLAAAGVPVKLRRAWDTKIGNDLTAPVISEGLVLACDSEAQSVTAVDAASGKTRWTFATGAPVDSPPTLWAGRALVGCRNGWVYCLRASDGELAWSFRAAPVDRRVVESNRIASVWPVNGSILVRKGVAWFAAGRTSFIDGGIYLYRLDAATGQQLSMTRVDSRDPMSGGQPADAIVGFGMSGALNDILTTDGQYVYMRQMVFNPDGSRCTEPRTHLFSPTGFLDDSWWHRSYWLVGPYMNSGFRDWTQKASEVPTGRLLVMGKDAVFSFARTNATQQASHVGVEDTEYRLYCASATPQDYAAWTKAGGYQSAVRQRWQRKVPILGRAMTLAGTTLWVAGPPDLLAQKNDDAADAIAGKKGGTLMAVSAENGKTLAEYTLDYPPVFDGMAVSGNRLYLTTLDGRIECYVPQE